MWPRPSSEDSSVEGISATYPWLLGGVALEGRVKSNHLSVCNTFQTHFNIINVFHRISTGEGKGWGPAARFELSKSKVRFAYDSNCFEDAVAEATPTSAWGTIGTHPFWPWGDLRDKQYVRRWDGDGKRHRHLPWRILEEMIEIDRTSQNAIGTVQNRAGHRNAFGHRADCDTSTLFAKTACIMQEIKIGEWLQWL